jgi:hypothetical protein
MAVLRVCAATIGVTIPEGFNRDFCAAKIPKILIYSNKLISINLGKTAIS